MKIKTHQKMSIAIGATLLLFGGCGDNSNSVNSQQPKTGTFVDETVIGLSYSCGQYSGITDSNGSFTYENGKPCTFTLGSLALNVDANELDDGVATIYEATDDPKKAIAYSAILRSVATDSGNILKIDDAKAKYVKASLLDNGQTSVNEALSSSELADIKPVTLEQAQTELSAYFSHEGKMTSYAKMLYTGNESSQEQPKPSKISKTNMLGTGNPSSQEQPKPSKIYTIPQTNKGIYYTGEYDPTASYPSNSAAGIFYYVKYQNNYYKAQWWSSQGQCPVKKECSSQYPSDDFMWVKVDRDGEQLPPEDNLDPTPYDASKVYNPINDGKSVVTFNNKEWMNWQYVAAGQCPDVTQCKEVYAKEAEPNPTQTSTPWSEFDLSEYNAYKKEVAEYKAKYKGLALKDIPVCSGIIDNDTIKYVDDLISKRTSTNGDLAGLSLSVKELTTIQRAYFLPCHVNMDITDESTLPANVKEFKALLTKSIWDEQTATKFTGNLNTGEPINKASYSYENLLKNVARAPYFCGEKGKFNTVKEACQREVSALIAHSYQETGSAGKYGTLLSFVREIDRYPTNMKMVSQSHYNQYYNEHICTDKTPFCNETEQHYYYGRGAHQTTWWYNYLNLSSAYFGGENYKYLLNYPDLVAREGELGLASMIQFAITPTGNKPSMHEVMLGLYQPKECKTFDDCGGLIYDETTGVKSPFSATISIINGGFECKATSATETNPVNTALNRTKNFTTILKKLGATLSPDEEAIKTKGCILASGNIFADNPNASANNKIYLDKECNPTKLNGKTGLNYTYEGVVDVCKGLYK